MTAVPECPTMPRARDECPGGMHRLRSGLVGVWAALTGIAPHVLHHVGPLAGTAFIAGAGGQVVFGVAGLALSLPTLVRLRRRSRTWTAPLVALAVFAAMFSVSAFVVGPRISGTTSGDATESADHGTHDDHADEFAPTNEGG